MYGCLQQVEARWLLKTVYVSESTNKMFGIVVKNVAKHVASLLSENEVSIFNQRIAYVLLLCSFLTQMRSWIVWCQNGHQQSAPNAATYQKHELAL